MSSHNSARAYLGLGGNLSDPRSTMAAALDVLNRDPGVDVAEVSSLYRTPPWGKTDQPDFLNAVAGLDTTLSPRGLLDLCLSTEQGLKRVRQERWGPRVIDLDLLWFGGRAIEEEGLTVPHPRMIERAFVLEPFAEIAPELELFGKSVAEWLAQIDRSGIVRLPDQAWWRQFSDQN